jgi:hypothetical protein
MVHPHYSHLSQDLVAACTYTAAPRPHRCWHWQEPETGCEHAKGSSSVPADGRQPGWCWRSGSRTYRYCRSLASIARSSDIADLRHSTYLSGREHSSGPPTLEMEREKEKH